MPGGTLDILNLKSGYGETIIVDDVSLCLSPGERLAVLGRNGVGKTTLLASIMGLTRRHAGSIRIDGRDVTAESASARARSGIGYVPQTRDVFRSLTVEENLIAGLKGRPRDALALGYDLFPRLRERRKNLASQLSGGEQQMLAIARSILGEPTILLLDEPLEGLAPVICDQLMNTLVDLSARSNMTTILVEQQIVRALDFADRAAILARGKLAWEGTSSALLRSPDVVEQHIGVVAR